ncbi:DEAD/DEAH box helicase, partial [bacterium]
MPPRSRSKADPIPSWTPDDMRSRLKAWMKDRGWKPLAHQLAMWEAVDRGESGLLQMPTGAGKTYAAFFGLLAHIGKEEPGLQLLYITPLRALTRDLEKS